MPFLLRLNPFNHRRGSVRWVAIISLLCVVVAVGGCSAARIGYNNAPTLTYWWLDRYFDFDTAQSVRMRADLQTLHAWHRSTEMPRAAALMQSLRTATPDNTTPEQLCARYADLKNSAESTLDRLVPTLSEMTPALTDAQLAHITQAFDKRNRVWREEWLDGTPQERAERRAQQMVSRAENFYGSLTPVQVALVQTHVNASDVDLDALYRERLVRQKDAVQTLRTLRDTGAPPAQREAQLHALLARAMQPPDPAVRETWNRRTNQSCAAVAALHNSSTPAQRVHLAAQLQNYENDVRVLIGQR